MKYDLRIRDSRGVLLEVVQEIPSKGDKFPTVILVPGFGMDLHEYGLFDELSAVLIKSGFQVIRFSFAGTGKSEGNFETMTLESQIQQLKDIIAYVAKDRFTKPRKIGILGQSFGAATIIASLPIPKIKTILLASASTMPSVALAKQLKRQRSYNPEGTSILLRTDQRKIRVGYSIWKSLAHFNLIGSIAKATQPVLFIYGSKDRTVKLTEAHQYFAAVPGKKKIHIIELADHGFTGKFRPKFLDLVVEWFEETLR